MLKQMSEAGAAGSLIFRADEVPEIDASNWRTPIFVNKNIETIGETMTTIRDHNFHLLATQQCGRGNQQAFAQNVADALTARTVDRTGCGRTERLDAGAARQ